MWQNMKCIIGLAAALLMAACSNDVVEPETGTPDAPKGLGEIVITLPTKKLTTRTDGSDGTAGGSSHDELHGEVNVDKGVILIFSNAEQDRGGDFTFEKKINVEFKEKTFEGSLDFNGGSNDDVTRMTATAMFEPEEGKYYKIYAYAYNSKGVAPQFDLGSEDTPKRLQKDDDEDVKEGDAMAAVSIARPADDADKDATMEVYGGWIYEFSGDEYHTKGYPEAGTMMTGPVLNATEAEILNYGGSLSRQTGRFEITLTDVPSTVTKATLIVEEYQPKIPVSMGHYTNLDDNSWYYFRNPFQPEEKAVAAITPTDGTLHFSTDMFPIDPSNVFIEIEDSEKGTNKYQIRVKDQIDHTNFIGVSVYITKANRISVFPNFWLGLNTEYKNLLQEGNWTIDFDWGDDYNSNVSLTPPSGSSSK